MFGYLYNKVVSWSQHQRAPYILAGVSFVESSIFPIPPDVMLIPMILGKPLKAWYYALITTVASVFGGLLGYIIGYFAFEAVGYSVINYLGYAQQYTVVVQWFEHYGWLAVLFAGITPIPYKLFTIASGVVAMPLLGFISASILGRAMRFYLVALLVKTVGKSLEQKFIKYIDWMGWGLVILCSIAYMGYYVYKH